jgi:heme/copper-type cytochrome/quinol oxidase subunit 3
MIASSLAISAAARLAGRDTGRAITMLNVTSWLAVIFIGLKTWEWAGHLGHGMYPATSTFAALYFLFTGVHAIHVAGGLVANVYARFAAATEERFRNRLAAVGLYWCVVDIVWLVIFVLLYVL